MDDTIQQALFGGNISGRRLRGVKINPIYQENDPGIREGLPGDTQSESALPIGEIQIEVYESLPRNCQWPYRPHNSAPTVPSPNRRSSHDSRLRESGEGCSQTPSCSACGQEDEERDGQRREDTESSCTERERWRGKGTDGRGDSNTAVKGAMGVDCLPWTFLQERSPAKREPLWGAFLGLENNKLPRLREDGEDCQAVRKSPSEPTSSSSSETRQAIASLEDLDICSEDDTDISGNMVESSGEGAQPGDNCSSTGQSEKSKLSDNKSFRNISSTQYQAYFVSMRDALPDLGPLLTQNPFPFDSIDCYSKNSNGKNGFSDFFQLVAHNHHQCSTPCATDGTGTKELKGLSKNAGRNGTSFNYTVLGGNGIKINRMISPEDGQVLCACPCHVDKHSPDIKLGMAGPILTDDNHVKHPERVDSKNSNRGDENVSSEKGTVDTENKNSSSDHQQTPGSEGDRSTPLINHVDNTIPEYHKHSADCLMDFENNNNCIVLYKVRKEDLRAEDFVSAEGKSESAPPHLNENQKPDTPDSCPNRADNDRKLCSKDGENRIQDCPELKPENQSAEKDSHNNLQGNKTMVSQHGQNVTDNVDSKSETIICKLCGCLKNSNNQPKCNSEVPDNGKPTCLVADGKTTEMISPYLHTPNDVTALFSSDSILLRAEELNAPAYLQRYLVQAQRNYLQRQAQLHHHDIITTDTSSALPSSDECPAGVKEYHHNSDLIIPDTGELLTDYGQYVDSVSYIEELSSNTMKKKKSFKSGASSKPNSKQSSWNSSRQSSQNSRNGNHCSIEDLEAAEEDELGEGFGSRCGGSSNGTDFFPDQNAGLKKGGLSIIHVGGTVSDPAFEMIVPYEEDFEQESKYSSRRRQRREEMEDQKAWKEEQSPLRERIIKVAVCSILLCVFVGIFVGVAIHFGNDISDEEQQPESQDRGVLSSGSVYGVAM